MPRGAARRDLPGGGHAVLRQPVHRARHRVGRRGREGGRGAVRGVRPAAREPGEGARVRVPAEQPGRAARRPDRRRQRRRPDAADGRARGARHRRCSSGSSTRGPSSARRPGSCSCSTSPARWATRAATDGPSSTSPSEAAVSALDQFKDADEVGLWVFSTDLGGADPNVRELVPVAPIGDQRDELAATDRRPVPDERHAAVRRHPEGLRDDARGLRPDEDQRHRAAHRRRRTTTANPATTSEQFDELIQTLQAGSEGASSRPVRLFTISYGDDADVITLQAIAQATEPPLRRQQPGDHRAGVHRRHLQLLRRWRRTSASATASSRRRWREAIMSPLGIVLLGAGAAGGDPGRAADRRPPPGSASVGLGWPGARRGAARSDARHRVAPSSAQRAVAVVRPCRPRRPSAASTGSSTSVPPGRCGSASQPVGSARRRHRRVVADRPARPRDRRRARQDRHRVGRGRAGRAAGAGGQRDAVAGAGADDRGARGPARVGQPARRRSPSRAAIGCACSTPASTSSLARAVEVSVGAGDTDVLGDDVDGLVTELEALRIAMDEAEPGGRSPTRCPEPRAAVTPRERAAPLERRRRDRHRAVPDHRAGPRSPCSATSSARPRSPTPTGSATRHRTSSTSCCSAACCRRRSSRCSRRSSRHDDEESTNVVITVALIAARRDHGRRRHRRPADLPPLHARSRRRRRRRRSSARSARCSPGSSCSRSSSTALTGARQRAAQLAGAGSSPPRGARSCPT